MEEEDQFRAVLGFLESFETEVSGRSAEILEPHMKAKIRELAAGILNDHEREHVLEKVARNRAGLDLLARCLERRR
jgi:DNA-binding FrmR family transcriptional regulator